MKQGIEGTSNGENIIILTENREPLLNKLEEYRERMDPYKAPELQIGTAYKITVVELLLKNGLVSLNEVTSKLESSGNIVDKEKLKDVFDVIKDYVQTGGKNLEGGTGLPR